MINSGTLGSFLGVYNCISKLLRSGVKIKEQPLIVTLLDENENYTTASLRVDYPPHQFTTHPIKSTSLTLCDSLIVKGMANLLEAS